MWPSCPLHKKLPVCAWLLICTEQDLTGIKAEADVGRYVLISQSPPFLNKRIMEEVIAGAGGGATGLVSNACWETKKCRGPHLRSRALPERAY